jgi:hypothetical protein
MVALQKLQSFHSRGATGSSQVGATARFWSVERLRILMRYLITGGAGFIGSHLSDVLLDRGHRVHILDDLSTGTMDNIRHLKGNPRFDYSIETASN